MLSLLLVNAFALITMAQTDIKEIDFANFSFVIENVKVTMKDGVQEKTCQKRDENGIPSGDIWSVITENIAYGDLDGDGKDEAMIPLVANICDGNMITNEAVLVYTIKNGKLIDLPTFDYYDEGCKGGEKGCDFSRSAGVLVNYDAKEKALIIETYFSTDDDAICCPSLYRETLYKWNGSGFVEVKKGKILKKEKEEEN